MGKITGSDGTGVIIKNYIKFLQVMAMSGGINDVAMPKVFDKIKELEDALE